MRNPVRRLVTILEETKSVSPAKTYDAWATVLSVDPSDKAAVLFSVGELIRLVETAQAAALDAGKDMDEAVVARPFRQLTKWLQGMNLEGNWDQFRRKMPADMLTGLRFCAEIVEREYGDGELGEDELEEFRARAQELLQELEESDLPDDLKSVLRDSLLSSCGRWSSSSFEPWKG